MRKSQTATEYLIILAVVIVIALIVVGVLGGIPSLGAGNSQRTTQTKLSNQDIGITSYAVTDTGTSVTIRNNAPTTARVTTLVINSTTCVTDDLATTLLSGESRIVFCSNIRGTAGQKYNLPINVTWSENDVAYTQGGINIAGTTATSQTSGNYSQLTCQTNTTSYYTNESYDYDNCYSGSIELSCEQTSYDYVAQLPKYTCHCMNTTTTTTTCSQTATCPSESLITANISCTP